MQSQDGVQWTTTRDNTTNSAHQDFELLYDQQQKAGVSFHPHPLTTAIPWCVNNKVTARSVIKMIAKATRKRLLKAALEDLEAKIEKMERAGKQYE